jgi:tetratricopeptide (TPR) repeat protein
MPKARPPRQPFGSLDRWLFIVLCGMAGTALIDRGIASLGGLPPDEWLALALAPVVVGWGAAGVIERSSRSAALVASGLYALLSLVTRASQGESTLVRPELVGLLVVAVFSAHAGRVARGRSEREQTARAFVEALGAGQPLPPAIGVERLRGIGVTSAVLTEAGLLGALLALQRGRERQTWLTSVSLAGSLWVIGIATGVAPALWLGAGGLLVWVVAFTLRLQGAGAGRGPYDALAAGYFDRAVTEFLKVLAAVPADTLARLGLAIGQYRLGRHDDAVQEFLKARQFGFRDLPLGIWLGVERELALALRGSGAGRQAVSSFERLQLIFPAHAPTLYELGSTLSELGEERAATQALRRAQQAGSREARELLAAREASEPPAGDAT